MPESALRPCTGDPKCPELTKGGPCEKHRKARQKVQDVNRGTAQQRGYTYRWSQTSKRFLARFPICGMRSDGARYREHSICTQEGRLVAAKCTDHIIAKQHGGTDHEDNLQALCFRCNTVKAIRYEGGFGHPVKAQEGDNV